MLNDELISAFSEFNDAAAAISHTQIEHASAAVARLEKARRAFHTLFFEVVRAEGNAARASAPPAPT